MKDIFARDNEIALQKGMKWIKNVIKKISFYI